MKLLVVSHSCATPINQQFFAEVERVARWQITLVIPSNWRNEYGAECPVARWPGFNGKIVPVPVWKSGNIILHSYKTSFRRLFRDLRPDAIYINHEPYAVATAQIFIANRGNDRKPIGFYSCQNIAKRYPPPFGWLEKMVLSGSDFFFPVSSESAKVFRGKGYKGPLAVLPLGLDETVYHPCPEGLSLKQDLKKSANEVLIGYVGRIVREKGLSTLLKSLKSLGELPWRLIVIGAGPYESEFEAMASSLGIAQRITRLGFIAHDKTPVYLSALDMLVLPSETQSNWKEQFGRVLIESIACGTPVVGSDSGEIPNLIRSTEGGLVFPEGQDHQLAECLKRLIVDESFRRQLGETGRQNAIRLYAHKSLAASFVSTVQRAVSIGGARDSAGATEREVSLAGRSDYADGPSRTSQVLTK